MKKNYRITDDFISDLEKLFPQLEIEANTPMQDIYYNAGVRKVIETIKRLKLKQDKEI